MLTILAFAVTLIKMILLILTCNYCHSLIFKFTALQAEKSSKAH